MSEKTLEERGADIMYGVDKSIGATLLRPILWVFSLLFYLVVTLRTRFYLSGVIDQADFSTMLVSVGNLTTGGTGKTPVVEKLSHDLCQRGKNVAILTRGYKSKSLKNPQSWDGISPDEAYDLLPKVVSDHHRIHLRPPYSGDEPFMLAKNLPGVAVLADSNRVKSAQFALDHLQSDLFILDDGMQHLQLRHKFDIVLLDQSKPFGINYLIPRGDLREPARELKRADLIIITKCKGPTTDAIYKRIRKYNPHAGIVECSHSPVQLVNQITGESKPLSYLQDKYVYAFSGIAGPKSFEVLLEREGAKIAHHRTFPDHHNFTQQHSDRIMDHAFRKDVDLIVTTEKDAVRFPTPQELDLPIYYLRIEIDIHLGQQHWDRAINTICGASHLHPVEYGVQQLEHHTPARLPR